MKPVSSNVESLEFTNHSCAFDVFDWALVETNLSINILFFKYLSEFIDMFLFGFSLKVVNLMKIPEIQKMISFKFKG